VNQPYENAVDADMAAHRATALLESEIKARIESVRSLAQLFNALNAAIAEYETAWQSAGQAGWSEDKLLGIGLRAPDRSAVAGRRAAPAAEQSSTMAPVVHLSQPAPAAPYADTAQSVL
jgi:hypothetical protein